MKLMEQPWRKVKACDKNDKVVLIPTASLEQHGDHLPLGVDTFIAGALAAAAEAELSDLVVLVPTVWFGHSPHHMAFPGTISVTHTLYADVLTQIVSSLIEAGFSKFVLLNGHGGNGLPMQMALQSLKNEWRNRRNVFTCAFNYWNLAKKEMEEIRESAFGGMGHACEMETSVMQFLHEDLVEEDYFRKDGFQLKYDWFQFDMLSSPSTIVVNDMQEVTETGTFGDPLLASAEKGKRFFDVSVQRIVGVIKDISASDLSIST